MPNATTELAFWQTLAPELAACPDCPAAAELLIPHGERTIYRVRLTQDETGWGGARSWFNAPCLCREEAVALRALLSYPDRRHGDLQKLSRPRIDILPTPLRAILADAEHRKALLERLESLVPYAPESLPAAPDWLWHFESQNHWNLLYQDARAVPRPGWREGVDDWRFGPLVLDEGYLHVRNSGGLAGLIDGGGRVVLPCRYAWLGGVHRNAHGTPVMEAQRPGDPADESELINPAGHCLNPPGIKLLAGSLRGGHAVAVREGAGETGLKGLLSDTGALLGDLRWRWIKTLWNGRAAAQDAATGCWGYIDAGGVAVIPPQFQDAFGFNDERACFCPQGDAGHYGMIDPQGRVAIEPCWKNIESLRRHYLVENDAGEYGVVDRDGHILIPPRPATEAERRETGWQPLRGIKQSLENELHRQAQARQLWRRIEEHPEHSLIGLRGLFDDRTGQPDLIDAGIWGMRVAIAEDCSRHGWDFKAGDCGMIFWQHPVSANLFNLAEEAPVMGLFGRGELCLGVPWALLRKVRE